MHRNKSVNVHQFAMVPKADIPRSSFRIQKTHKTTFDAGLLIPLWIDEVLPGDTFNVKATIFARMATPIYPVMDNLYLETFFFFVPCRLVWDNWVKFMGEQENPADSISYTVPQIGSLSTGFPIGGIYDYAGIPTGIAVSFNFNALPFRAYNLIWNTWFRDENLQNSVAVAKTDGPDAYGVYALKRRGKRHDYFTSALPWTQKGGVSVPLPLAGQATVRTSATNLVAGNNPDGITVGVNWRGSSGGAAPGAISNYAFNATEKGVIGGATGQTAAGITIYPVNLYADLSTATATTINQLRQSFQIQKLLERDARGGTRYTELVRSHFGVMSPDARLQRPEYLGGGSTPINVNPVAQTSGTSASGTTTPLGQLAGYAHAVGHNHGFTQSFTEHGYVIGLVSVRADLTYQQGLRKMFSRLTRYDFYFPVFAMLGEQAVLNKEIYLDGSANDALVFGYQERWAEYRYNPSQITGLFRSTAAGTLDGWHLSQRFLTLPALNNAFIEDTPPLSRVLAVGAGANGAQFLLDSFWDVKAARPLPLYSVPGLIDHF